MTPVDTATERDREYRELAKLDSASVDAENRSDDTEGDDTEGGVDGRADTRGREDTGTHCDSEATYASRGAIGAKPDGCTSAPCAAAVAVVSP